VGSKPASVEYAVLRAVRRGELRPIRECICVDCGAPARHYDHRDYNKPTEVEPVCYQCNHRRGPAIRYAHAGDLNKGGVMWFDSMRVATPTKEST
jgi:hypothetical protein